MKPQTIIAHVEAAGGHLSIRDGKLFLSGADDPRLIDLLRKHRRALLDHLSPPAIEIKPEPPKKLRRSIIWGEQPTAREPSMVEIYRSRMAARDAIASQAARDDSEPFELPIRRIPTNRFS